MSKLSDAAKAASILHHTWGIDNYDMAVQVFNRLGDDTDSHVVDVLEEYNAGVWEPLDQLSQEDWWENVESLALSIDAAHKYFNTKENAND